jgi:hypothetical protein
LQAFNHNEMRIVELHEEIAKVHERGMALKITNLPTGTAALDFVLHSGGQSVMDPHMQLVQLMMDLEVRLLSPPAPCPSMSPPVPAFPSAPMPQPCR